MQSTAGIWAYIRYKIDFFLSIFHCDKDEFKSVLISNLSQDFVGWYSLHGYRKSI